MPDSNNVDALPAFRSLGPLPKSVSGAGCAKDLKERLANSQEWIEFEGTLFSQPLMGGYANVDDDVFDIPGGTYRGVAPRSFEK